MKIDVEGRVSNTTLAASKPLLPLYEAIVNSIQSIEDAGVEDGRISIDIRRDSQQVLEGQDPSIRSVTGFDITDNGIGFNEANFQAFNTSDTTIKAKRGGKGVGRFLWLVAFREVEVESIYEDNGGYRRRTFRFVPTGDGVSEETDESVDASTRSTTVRLIGLREKYAAHCHKKPETIASHIAEHCLEFFIRGNCPQIELNDEATQTEHVSVNRLFEKDMLEKSEKKQFEVKGQSFHVTHVRLYSSHAKDHQAHFCANDRVVQSKKLTSRIPNLHTRIEDDKKKKFLYAAYVESDVLNDAVNAERTGFAIDDEATEVVPKDIGWSDIIHEVEEQSKEYLRPYTDPIREEKRRRIDAFVAQQAPMYRPILPYIEARIDRIDPNADDDSLDLELYRAYHELEVATKEEGTSLLKAEVEAAESLDEFEARLDAYFEKVTELKKSDLARYVCQRKTVLDFLQKLLSKRDDGKYHVESKVHNVIFPMGKTSEEVLLQDHNLWLLDERLAYHAFLASDKQLRTLPTFDGDSQKEPDIIAYDKTCAFSPSTEMPYSAITLVEFKRPMRDDYSEDENPFTQLCDYMDLLRENNALTPDGRAVRVTESTPFYCYIVCDLRPRLHKWASRFDLDKTPDELGYFGYNRQYNAYFEVISYDKLVEDAKQRNAIFFEKLNLPSRVSVATAAATSQGP